MLKVLVFGPSGSMGTLISRLALQDKEIDVVAACDVNNIGEKLADVIGQADPNNIIIANIDDLKNVIKETQPEVAVDFTVAEATETNSIICVENGVSCVIGTTGLSEEFKIKFQKKIEEYNIPAVISSNMATGVNVYFKMISIISKYLQDWDIEIIEAHHHRKRDSPSGTALTIGKIISEAINSDFEEIAKFGRDKGPNKRELGAKNEIGVHSIRAGDIVGDHIVLYAGSGERIEFKHQAHSRDCFATGAIKAIKFIAKQTEPKIFEMREVLSLR
ncbi:MAG: 4-hydroxy-tetrahydrodipicolinate reductase [Candidatus Lokiarchaeota archaeon]|nr:4-hydroxy-tetrahydrodipicolinate reductase [Candidatus Lokiarchaeota archaeon]